ncbi:MAG: hypothetical protein M3Z26_13400 [Bacteroidota bacterium]|nr:hypothetical protein [Bacteroidota bacterium]
MKIEQVLVHYLLKTKYLALQSIGTFQLDANLPDSSDPDKPILIPADAIKFKYDPKTKEDNDLVDFIVLHTKKIKPLASSDLDSFLSLGRQFLNIGKPFSLSGIGTLEKLNSGDLIFIGGQLVAPRMEPQRIKIEDKGAEEHDENMFNDYQKERKKSGGQKALFTIFALIILGMIGWALWHFVFNKNNQQNISTTETIVPVTDSAHKRDSLAIYSTIIDSSKTKKNISESSTFKVVIKEYPNIQLASARLSKLTANKRNVIMYTTDSITYKIAESFVRPLSDTTKVLDSLSRFYPKSRIYIEY